MTEPNIPLYQQRALPLQTISEAQSPDTIEILGGQVVKFWGPSGTGINDVVMPAAVNCHVFLVTNYLDLAGCSNWAILVKRTDTANSAGSTAELMYQYRNTPITVMPTDFYDGAGACAGSLRLTQAGILFLKGGAAPMSFVATVIAPTTQYALVTSGPSVTNATVTNSNPSPVAIGSDVRFFISKGKTAGVATQTWSMSVWAAS